MIDSNEYRLTRSAAERLLAKLGHRVEQSGGYWLGQIAFLLFLGVVAIFPIAYLLRHFPVPGLDQAAAAVDRTWDSVLGLTVVLILPLALYLNFAFYRDARRRRRALRDVPKVYEDPWKRLRAERGRTRWGNRILWLGILVLLGAFGYSLWELIRDGLAWMHLIEAICLFLLPATLFYWERYFTRWRRRLPLLRDLRRRRKRLRQALRRAERRGAQEVALEIDDAGWFATFEDVDRLAREADRLDQPDDEDSFAIARSDRFARAADRLTRSQRLAVHRALESFGPGDGEVQGELAVADGSLRVAYQWDPEQRLLTAEELRESRSA